MQKRLAKLGYIEVESCEGEGWLAPGERARGHEFRYSVIEPMPEMICRVYRDPAEGYRVRSVLGSYVHLHFLSNPSFAERFVCDCAQRRAINRK
jgi:cobyrinic acid a,c-diamide synthase